MSSFVFPGYPSYLAAAADQLERPGAERRAGRLVALTDLANLCAQASRVEPAGVAAILAKAAEFRDQLAVALHAADAMLADVAAQIPPADDIDAPPPDTIAAPSPPLAERVGARKGKEVAS